MNTPRTDYQKSFEEWFLQNYPPDCILARPAWHAPKIYRAATHHLQRDRADLIVALRKYGQHELLCESLGGTFDERCDCGLSSLLARLESSNG